ncbi:MAG: hypothetical protein CVU63_06505, partial [Deltaproteobacteria bacterium HGW-Deltaproteobacteria-20]
MGPTAHVLTATAVTTAVVTLASYALPEEHAATGVGFAFLAAVYFLVLRRDTAFVRSHGLSLGGLLEPSAIRPNRMILDALGASAWAFGLALLIFPPFWLGFVFWWQPDQTFALTLPGATSFKWSVTTYINGSQMDGIRAGLTVMETNPARPKATCATCHGVTDHRTVHNQSPSNTCAVAGCHEQTNLLDTHATLSCVSCHANTDPTVSGAIAAGNGTCESCHSADGIHVHSDASLEGTETVFAEQCTSCHLVDFVAEHAKPTSSGRDRLCASCHSSADANVSATIAAKVTSCGECHGSWHDDDHPVALDTRCVKCHASDLSKGHAVRDIGCVSCHAQEPALAAVTFSRTACGDCHAIAHTQS